MASQLQNRPTDTRQLWPPLPVSLQPPRWIQGTCRSYSRRRQLTSSTSTPVVSLSPILMWLPGAIERAGRGGFDMGAGGARGLPPTLARLPCGPGSGVSGQEGRQVRVSLAAPLQCSSCCSCCSCCRDFLWLHPLGSAPLGKEQVRAFLRLAGLVAPWSPSLGPGESVAVHQASSWRPGMCGRGASTGPRG